MPVFPDGTEVYTASGDITAEEIARQLSQGKKVTFKQVTAEQVAQNFVSLGGFPPEGVAQVMEGFLFFTESGYYGGKPSFSKQGLARPTRTFAPSL
ncbi:hypothetical protein B0H14DRAFT_3473286 [Mycena olivaceomarginata]|nr:hypothetical protein B0H14DRAFT_3473286 [Mycena olivaceomarginata]